MGILYINISYIRAHAIGAWNLPRTIKIFKVTLICSKNWDRNNCVVTLKKTVVNDLTTQSFYHRNKPVKEGLVGGFNKSEKYARQIGSFPQGSG